MPTVAAIWISTPAEKTPIPRLECWCSDSQMAATIDARKPT